MFLSEAFWLLLSRVIFDCCYAWYNIAEVSFFSATVFIFLLFLLCIFSLLFCSVRVGGKSIRIKSKYFSWLTYVLLIINSINISVVLEGARYQSGGLIGLTGALYFIGRALFLFLVLVEIRHSIIFCKWKPVRQYLPLLISGALLVDGFASALTLFCVYFLLVARGNILRKWFSLSSVSVLLLTAGFFYKWGGVPSGTTVTFLLEWIISRFSIHAEQMLMVLSGQSYFGYEMSAWDLIANSINNRYELIIEGKRDFIPPRNVSEALYFDMKNSYGSGSSPGLALGLILLGWLPGTAILALMCRTIVRYFGRSTHKLNLAVMIAFAYILKPVFGNVTEIFVLMSPVLLYLVILVLSSLIEIRECVNNNEPSHKYNYSNV